MIIDVCKDLGARIRDGPFGVKKRRKWRQIMKDQMAAEWILIKG